MIAINEKEKCCGCSACVQICPKQCIEMCEDAEGFKYPKINTKVCVECSLCEKVCPVIKQDKDERVSNVEFEKRVTFAAISKDEDVRMNSSSGGVFSSLAEYVLEKKGVVFGAAFSEQFRKVEHIAIYDKEDLKLLRGSKYVQSEIGNTYLEAEKFLKADRMVMFTGTPCQIEGLKTYLRKEYEKLICLDIICHGVPSQKVWRKYITEREEMAGERTSQISFRNKRYGWKAYTILFEFLDKTIYMKTFYEDLYMKAFLKDLSLRPICYACPFKKINRVSDITLADFWGIEKIFKDMDDNKGTSLVIIHSKNGIDIWNEISEKIIYKLVALEEGLVENPSMVKSVKRNKYRDKFFSDLDSKSFEQLINKYDKKEVTLKRYIIAIVSRLGLCRKSR